MAVLADVALIKKDILAASYKLPQIFFISSYDMDFEKLLKMRNSFQSLPSSSIFIQKV